MNNNSEKGVSLYIAFMIVAILLVIGFGMSVILISQIKMLRGMGDSVVAFYAANTGIERTLFEINQGAETGAEFEAWLVENESKYIAQIISSDRDHLAYHPHCLLGEYYCIKSTGIYQGTEGEVKRAIWVTR